MRYDMSGKRILFINKNGMSDSLREILERQAHPSPEIVSANSQEEALSRLEKSVSLVILDALEVEHNLIIRKIQELNSQGFQIAFLCILPYREEEERESENPIWIGLADRVIYKPYTIHALEKAVKDVMGCACSCAT